MKIARELTELKRATLKLKITFSFNHFGPASTVGQTILYSLSDGGGWSKLKTSFSVPPPVDKLPIEKTGEAPV